jgi:membrane associated rhomboid family serine protease
MAVCYRHPGRETGVSCSNCGRPICPDCMTATQVGMRCPECSRQTTRVGNLRTSTSRPVVTTALVVLNILIWIGTASQGSAFSAGGSVLRDLGLDGPDVAAGQYYRLVTSGFLHVSLIHVGFNMYILWWLGHMVEPALGSVRFAALYFASLLCGSFGALLLSPNQLTVGASGAVFGLMGAAFVMQRARGINPMQSGIGMLIILNLVFSLVVSNVSIGGHLGGLIGGAACGWLIERVSARRRGLAAPVAICAGIGVVAVALSLAVA